MKDLWLQILGTTGNILLVTAYVPQIIKMIHTKKVEGVSLGMWILYAVGDGCFLAYALIQKDLFTSILFGFFALENLTLLFLIIFYGHFKKTKLI